MKRAGTDTDARPNGLGERFVLAGIQSGDDLTNRYPTPQKFSTFSKKSPKNHPGGNILNTGFWYNTQC